MRRWRPTDAARQTAALADAKGTEVLVDVDRFMPVTYTHEEGWNGKKAVQFCA